MTGTLIHKNDSNLNERWMKVEQNEQQKLVSKVPLHWMDVLNVGWISLQSRWKVAFRGRDSLITSFQPTHPSQPSPTYHQCQKSFTITSPSDVSLPRHLPRATCGISLFFLSKWRWDKWEDESRLWEEEGQVPIKLIWVNKDIFLYLIACYIFDNYSSWVWRPELTSWGGDS